MYVNLARVFLLYHFVSSIAAQETTPRQPPKLDTPGDEEEEFPIATPTGNQIPSSISDSPYVTIPNTPDPPIITDFPPRPNTEVPRTGEDGNLLPPTESSITKPPGDLPPIFDSTSTSTSYGIAGPESSRKSDDDTVPTLPPIASGSLPEHSVWSDDGVLPMPDPTPPFSSISTLIPSVPSIPTSEPLRQVTKGQVTKGQVTKSNDKDGFILQTTTNGPGEFVAGALGMGAAAITQPPWRVTLGGEVFTADNHDEIVVHGQTLKPGGSAVTVDGSTISLSAGDGGQVVADVGGLIVTLDGARQTGQDVVTGDGSRLRWTRWNAAVLGGWLVVMMVL